LRAWREREATGLVPLPGYALLRCRPVVSLRSTTGYKLPSLRDGEGHDAVMEQVRFGASRWRDREATGLVPLPGCALLRCRPVVSLRSTTGYRLPSLRDGEGHDAVKEQVRFGARAWRDRAATGLVPCRGTRFFVVDRWCRFAQPPATGCHPFGMGRRVLSWIPRRTPTASPCPTCGGRSVPRGRRGFCRLAGRS
jgi:hypothetical protein